MGVFVKDPPLRAWAPTGVSPLHEVRWALELQWGVSKLSSDLLMYLEPVKQREMLAGVPTQKAKFVTIHYNKSNFHFQAVHLITHFWIQLF